MPFHLPLIEGLLSSLTSTLTLRKPKRSLSDILSLSRTLTEPIPLQDGGLLTLVWIEPNRISNYNQGDHVVIVLPGEIRGIKLVEAESPLH